MSFPFFAKAEGHFTGSPLPGITPAAAGIQVYPNPATSGTITLEYELAGPSKIRVELYNMIGRQITTLLYSERSMGLNQESLQLPSSLPDGTYLLRIESAEGISTQRLFIRSNNP